MENFIEVLKLVKNYGDFCAVDNLSFEVKKGEIFGLLGPNGAGKSTTINILSSLLTYQKGSAKINGLEVSKNASKVKALIGLVPQDIALYDYLSAYENVSFFASCYGLKGQDLKNAVNDALEFVGLLDKAKLKPKKMSGGMKRRLNIACGIAHRPQLIIMDEPTVGVDTQSRDYILNSIKKLRENGVTIIYTSHYMNEVEELCDRIAIVDHGKLVACGSKNELIALTTDVKSFQIKFKSLSTFHSEKFIIETLNLPSIKNVSINENMIKIDTALDYSDISHLFDYLKDKNIEIIAIQTLVPDLDTVFLALTGREIR